MSDFDVRPSTTPLSAEERQTILAAPGFGQHFTDHMVTVPFADGAWGTPVVEAYGPLSIDPSAVVLHYAQTIFEGLKAYRQADDSIASFRAERRQVQPVGAATGHAATPGGVVHGVAAADRGDRP